MRILDQYFYAFAKTSIFLLLLSCATGYDKHADRYYEEGLLFYERMEYDRSIESFNKVLELAPHGNENHIVYYNRGMAHLKNRQYDESIYDFTKALELTSARNKELRFEILEFRGEANQKSKKLDNAIMDYSDAIKLMPEHNNITYIYTSRGWVWFAKGNYSSSINDFSQAIRIDPELGDAYFGRATVWFKKGDLQRSLTDAKEAVILEPTNKLYEDLLFEIKSSLNQK